MLGADHHGYIGRLRRWRPASATTPGETLEILIGQLVNLVKDGEPVRMSKRAGNVITLEDLVDASASTRPATRWPRKHRLAHRPRSRPAGRADQRQPGLLRAVRPRPAERAAAQRGRAGHRRGGRDGFDVALLTHEREADLLGTLGEFPRVVASAAELREPHRVARYLEELAGGLPPLVRRLPGAALGRRAGHRREPARLWLVEATRIVLANGLALLGVSAPERM